MEANENKRNTECMLYGSPHCALLNEESCEKCFFAKLEEEQQLEAAEDICYIAQALPEEGVEPVMKGEECALCRRERGEEAETAKATCFAQLDMGHEHPLAGAEKDGKYDRAASMVIPVQLPACGECRKRLNLQYYLPLSLGVLTALIGLIVTAIEPVRIPLSRAGRALPFLVFLIFVFLGVIVESVSKKLLSERVERTMNTREKRIPALAELVKRGWFAVGKKDGMIPFTFTNERLPSGILTGENQRELLEKIRDLGVEGVRLMRERAGKKEAPEEKTGE